jgi:hypothetical protein
LSIDLGRINVVVRKCEWGRRNRRKYLGFELVINAIYLDNGWSFKGKGGF